MKKATIGMSLELERQCRQDVVNRLRRVQGQVAGIVAMIEDGRACSEVVMQLAAASRALDRAGFKVISAEMQRSAIALNEGREPELSPEKLEKLFLSLS
jgi:DNA-binding FrmR family transcriptional regulator